MWWYREKKRESVSTDVNLPVSKGFSGYAFGYAFENAKCPKRPKLSDFFQVSHFFGFLDTYFAGALIYKCDMVYHNVPKADREPLRQRANE